MSREKERERERERERQADNRGARKKPDRRSNERLTLRERGERRG